MNHPATSPTRHDTYYRLNARNRVWVARRNLPWPLVVVYLTVWTVLTVVRFRSPRLLRVWFAGFREGLGPGCRGTAADALADRVAADTCRSPAGGLTYRFRTGGGP